MTPRQMAGLVLALGVTALLAGDGAAMPGKTTPAFREGARFRESAWPFLLDQWGRGRAFRCQEADCGAEASLYVRSKVGFCDCFNHVDDDDDVDRLTDFDLMGGDQVVPLGPGQPIAVGGQPARWREFRLEHRLGKIRRAVAVVVATDCQAVVGMLVTDRDAAPAIETAALDLVAETLRHASGMASSDRTDATR
jgi:hypothetical protein